MAGTVLTPGDDHDPPKQGWRRSQCYLHEINPPSYPLNESQPVRCLHKALRTQRSQTTQALTEHVRLNPSFHAYFLGIELVVLMWWWFWVCGTALGA
jgi:hypothetical protein